ncbi:MAG: hypothetical protein RLZZ272_194 [Actinomycetota bacterium]
MSATAAAQETSAPPRRAPVRIVVLGSHRSGSSALAGALRDAGVVVGDADELLEPGADNPRGFLERRDVLAITERLLASAGADWQRLDGQVLARVPDAAAREARAELAELVERLDVRALASNGAWVIKDPRLAVLLPVLAPVLDGALALITVRHPLEVAASLRRRNGVPIAAGIALWEAYTRSALAVTEGRERLIVSYGDLLADPAAALARVARRLEHAGLPEGRLDVELGAAFIATGLRAERASALDASWLTPTQQDLWDRLRDGRPVDAPVPLPRQTLEALEDHTDFWLRHARNSGTDVGPPALEVITERDRLRRALTAATAERDRMQAALRGSVARAREAAATLAQVGPELERRASEVAAANAQLEVERRAQRDTEAERARLSSALAAAEAARAELATASTRTERLLDEASSARERLAAELAEAQRMATALHDEGEHLRRRAAELVAERDRQADLATGLAAERSALAERLTTTEGARTTAEEHARAVAAERERLARRGAQLEGELERLRERLRDVERGRVDLERQLAAIRATRWWRWTEPLRRSPTLARLRLDRAFAAWLLHVGLHVLPRRWKHRLVPFRVRKGIERRLRRVARRPLRRRAIVPEPKDLVDTVRAEHGEDPATLIAALVADLAPGSAVALDPAQQVEAANRAFARKAPRATRRYAATIVIPHLDRPHLTATCVRAIWQHVHRDDVEVVLVDDGSDADTKRVLRRLRGVRHVRLDENAGFGIACNAGAAVARGEVLVFLNNDCLVLPGWLEHLLGTLDAVGDRAIVGSLLVGLDGRVGESGGTIWSDGTGANHGRGRSVRDPRLRFRRPADYVSGASLAIPRATFAELGGFDTEHYEHSYFEDTDLCFRLRAAGGQVLVQPASQTVHVEGGTAGTDEAIGAKAFQASNRRCFVERWAGVLAEHHAPGTDHALGTRRLTPRSVLVIDARLPRPDEDAGSVFTDALLRTFVTEGWHTAIVAQHEVHPQDDRVVARLWRDGIEVVRAPEVASLRAHLEARGDEHDLIIVFRHNIHAEVLPDLAELAPRARRAFFPADLHGLRAERERELNGNVDPDVLAAIRASEAAAVRASDVTVVHSTHEEEVLRAAHPDARVRTFPWISAGPTGPVTLEGRQDVLFVGGFGHPPNVDAARWLVEAIVPELRALGVTERVVVVGSKAPSDVLALTDRELGVEVLGFVPDLAPVFARARVFVAPLRYGAGFKGKVVTAMEHGVPTVLTPIAAEGMGLTDGLDMVVADGAAEIAAAITTLLRDDARWMEVVTTAGGALERQWGAAAAVQHVRGLVEACGLGADAVRAAAPTS